MASIAVLGASFQPILCLLVSAPAVEHLNKKIFLDISRNVGTVWLAKMPK